MSEKVEITPEVLLNMSDHYTRTKVSKHSANVRCIGGILGRVEGRHMRMMQAFEFKYTLNEGSKEIESIDFKFIKERIDLFKVEMSGNLFKDYEFLGWYSVGLGSAPHSHDLQFQKEISSHFQADPIYIVMDTAASTLKENPDLPVKVFEVKYEQIHVQEKYQTQESFVEVPYDIFTSKADTITIESASKSYSSSVQSQFAENLKTTVNAVSRFSEKVEGILKALENPAIASNPTLLLELNQILCSFPQQFHNSLDSKILEHYSEANIISFLSAIAASNRVISNVTDFKSAFKSKNF